MLRHRVGHPAELAGRLCSPFRPHGNGKDLPAESPNYDRMAPAEAPKTIPASYPMSEDL